MTDPVDRDGALVAAARAALERSAITHRVIAETSVPGSPPKWEADHAILADQAAEQAQRLADLDPADRVDASGLNALWAGQEELAREAASWRALAAIAREGWRAEFTASSDQAEQDATGVQTLRHRLFERDRGVELEAEP